LAQGGQTILVTNLHFEVTEDDLKELFKDQAGFLSTKIVWDKHDRSTGEATCEFSSKSSALSTVEALNHHDLSGQKLLLRME